MKKFKITIDGREYMVEVEEIKDGAVGVKPSAPPVQATVQTPAPRPERPLAATGSGGITAPMPGTILNVMVKAGDRVEYGQALVILEAMKMENNINANVAGTVTSIEVSQGQSVDTGQLLLTIE